MADDVLDLLLHAAGAAAGVAVNLTTIARHPDDIAASLETNEIAENLADALQTTLTLEHASAQGERAEMLGQYLAATRRFLDGWA